MSYQPTTHKERTLHRMKIAMGHLKKVISMIEDDAYCIDILHQSQAVQKGIQEASNLILENHLKVCTSNEIKRGHSDTAISEIMEILRKKNG